MSFVTEIQLMMHGFGDCRKPLITTATLIESIVHQQMTSFLQQAHDIADQRGSKNVGPEEILFIMRRDPLKLQRLIYYMGVRDLYQKASAAASTSTSIETDIESLEAQQSRKKICMNFLQSIDQIGQYEGIGSASMFDPVRLERSIRFDIISQKMTSQRYREYCEARRASFCPRLRVNKFREWLLREETDEIKLTQHVLEMLNFLAYETVAQIVDLALLVKRDARESRHDLSCFRSPMALNPDYPSILLQQGNSLQGVGGSTGDAGVGMDPITPADIREALRRYWANNSALSPFTKIHSPIQNRLLAG